MLVLSSPSRLLGSKPIVWLCDQEPVKSFQKRQPPEKAKLKRWWTYLSQFRLTVHHIPGIGNELSDYISRNNFDALIGETSEALAKEAFRRMDVELDLSMRTAGILEGWSLTDYQSEYKEILPTLSTGLEREGFIVISTLCVCCASPAACCWCRVSCCLFLMRKMFCLLKYNQSRIAQARDKQVEENQDQSMKGCSVNSERC